MYVVDFAWTGVVVVMCSPTDGGPGSVACVYMVDFAWTGGVVVRCSPTDDGPGSVACVVDFAWTGGVEVSSSPADLSFRTNRSKCSVFLCTFGTCMVLSIPHCSVSTCYITFSILHRCEHLLHTV